MTWKESSDRERERGIAPKHIHHWESDKGAASRNTEPQNQGNRKADGCDVRGAEGGLARRKTGLLHEDH